MIYIGCTTFSEHGALVHRKETTLEEYAGYFPVVELDTTYHFLPRESMVKNWLTKVPNTFKFILKVHQSVTTQGDLPEGLTMDEALVKYKQAIQPLVEKEQLFCLLAQFPNRFKCTVENVTYLRQLRQWFAGYPLAIEFRDASWYDPANLAKMRAFMQEHKFSLVIVDEPKKLSTTIPLDPFLTNQEFALCRFHGRNDVGWTATGPDAQAKRTFYRYNQSELLELKTAVEQTQKAKETAVIFNNNAGRDAAENALLLRDMLKLEYKNLNPNQLELF